MSSKVLFIPALFYLSNKLFLMILKHLDEGEVETIYMDCDYALNKKYAHNYETEISKIKKVFNDTEIIFDKVEYNTHVDSNKISLLKFYLRKRSINRKTIKTIKTINPELIVLTSDQTDAYKLITNYFSSTPVLVIQQGSLAKKDFPILTFRKKIRYALLKTFFNYPTLSVNPWKLTGKDKNKPMVYHAYWSKFWLFDRKITDRDFFTGNGTLDNDILIGNEKLKNPAPPKEKLRILYTTQPIALKHGVEKSRKINQIVLDFIKNTHNVYLTMKVHPRESSQTYHDIFRGISKEQVEIKRESDIVQLIDEADILLTAWSMTSYQAVARGVPVIALNPENMFDYSNRFPGKCVAQVRNVLELKNSVIYYNTNVGNTAFKKERKSFLKIINTYDDSQSSKRIADLIKYLVSTCGKS